MKMKKKKKNNVPHKCQIKETTPAPESQNNPF